MSWIYILFAGFFEIVWAVAMKQSHGFSHLGWSAVTIIGAIASIVLLAMGMKGLPVGTAYMVWTGIGAIGTFLVGIAVLGEAASALRMAGAAFVALGIVLMKFGEN